MAEAPDPLQTPAGVFLQGRRLVSHSRAQLAPSTGGRARPTRGPVSSAPRGRTAAPQDWRPPPAPALLGTRSPTSRLVLTATETYDVLKLDISHRPPTPPPPPSPYCSYLCVLGAVSAQPEEGPTGGRCPAGSYCPQGTLHTMPCPAGTFSSTPGDVVSVLSDSVGPVIHSVPTQDESVPVRSRGSVHRRVSAVFTRTFLC